MSETFVQKSIDEGKLDLTTDYMAVNDFEYSFISSIYDSLIYHTKGDYERALESAKTAHEATMNTSDYYHHCSHICLAYCYLKIGEINKAEECIEYARNGFSKYLETSSEEIKYWIRLLYLVLGSINAYYGRYDRSLLALEDCLKFSLQMTRNATLSGIYNNLGYYNLKEGNLQIAHEYYVLSLEICEQMGNDYDKYYPLSNLGNYYFIIGDIDLAEKIHQEALYIALKINHPGNILSQYRDLSQVYRILGDTTKSFQLLKYSLEIGEKIGNPVTLTSILVLLVDLSLEIANFDQAMEYYTKLELISEGIASTKLIQHYTLYAKSLSLKSKNRLKSKAKAMDILSEIIEEGIMDHQTTVKAMLEYCELLLLEAKLTNDANDWRQVNDMVQQLAQFAVENHLVVLDIEIIGLQANIDWITGDIDNAVKKCELAISCAQSYHLTNLEHKINNLRETILSNSYKIQEALMNNSALSHLIELGAVESYLREIIKVKDELTKM